MTDFRCRLGLHAWGRWRRTREVTTHRGMDFIGHHRPERDFQTSRHIQVRECARCGFLQRRGI